MKDRKEIIEWINNQINTETLFLSVHFDTPPTTKEEICARCRPIFKHLFRSLVGRHWLKAYNRYFTVIGFQEYGKYGNMHAHFLLVCRTKFNATTVLKRLITLSDIIKMDVWQSETDKATQNKRYSNDIVIKQTYSSDVINYTTKEIRIFNQRISDTLILDVDLFNKTTIGENDMSNSHPNTSGLTPFNKMDADERRKIQSAGGIARSEKARQLKSMTEIINGLRIASDTDPIESAVSNLYFSLIDPTVSVNERLRILTTLYKIIGTEKTKPA